MILKKNYSLPAGRVPNMSSSSMSDCAWMSCSQHCTLALVVPCSRSNHSFKSEFTKDIDAGGLRCGVGGRTFAGKNSQSLGWADNFGIVKLT